MPAPASNDEQVHVLEVEEAAPRSRLPLLLGVLGLVVVAGLGVWLWLDPSVLERFGGGSVATAPPPAAGNLLGDAWSFETTETTSASQAWGVPEGAPAGFSFGSRGTASGELAAVGRAGEQGWCRLLSEKAFPLGAHRGRVKLSGRSTSDDMQLLLRFEGAGRPPLDVVVASGQGALEGSRPVPPGYSAVRVGIGCVGEGALDDLDLRFVDGDATALERRGIFDLLALEPGWLVFRGDELVLQVDGLTVRADASAPLPPPSALWLPSDGALAVPGGGRVTRRVERGGSDKRLELTETLDGMPAGSLLVRSATVTGSLAEQPLGIVSARGFEQFTGDFRVEGVSAVVLGRTQDRLALALGEETVLSGTWQQDGSVLLRSETPAAGSASRRLALQTSFQEERVAASQHLVAAQEAETAGRLGQALAEAEIIEIRYPHDEDVTAQARALRGRVQGLMQERLDAIDRELADALFLASAARCREVLEAARASARTFAGSDAEARFLDRAATVAQRAADLLEEDRQRQAGRLAAVEASFREAGGYDRVADEIGAHLGTHLAPPGAGGDADGDVDGDAGGGAGGDADGGADGGSGADPADEP